MTRPYRLGRRQISVDQTRARILAAARSELERTPAALLSVGAVARRAGVTRATVYARYSSRQALIEALAPPPAPPAAGSENPRDRVRAFLAARCLQWAVSPVLYRNLPAPDDGDQPRHLADALADADGLRAGCSLKEAQDVLAALGSFGLFDRLHQDGRRSTQSVTEILMRLAGAILA